jgi:hypothetical protein
MGSSDLDMLQKQLEELKKKNLERKNKGVFNFFKKKDDPEIEDKKKVQKEDLPVFDEEPKKKEAPVHHEAHQEPHHEKPKKEVINDKTIMEHLDDKEKELLNNIDKLLDENG